MALRNRLDPITDNRLLAQNTGSNKAKARGNGMKEG